DPAPILHALMGDTSLAQQLTIAGVIATVDAVNGPATLERYPESVKQIAVADRLVLTKTDLLADPDDRNGVIGRLARLNGEASVIEASFGAIEPSRLFDAGA